MSYSLNSLKGGYIGEYIGTNIGGIKGDTRSLDYSSYPQHKAEVPSEFIRLLPELLSLRPMAIAGVGLPQGPLYFLGYGFPFHD